MERIVASSGAVAPPPIPVAGENPGCLAVAIAMPTQVVSFAVGKDHYGVDIMAVREIKGWTEITQLPKQPEYVCGVLNLRGVIVPIVDLRCRFGQGMTKPTALHIVIIVEIAARQVGLLADRVLDIISFEAAQVQPVPQVGSGSCASFLLGLLTVDSAMTTLINLTNLLTIEMEEIRDVQAA
jgi:purine-binding chemotaxis protein CheW